ncbi:MAG: ribonuclease H-like domain-containing protein [Hydrogenobaculum sp.]
MKILKPEEFICVHGHTGLEHPNCYIKYLDSCDTSNIGFLDIETSQLDAEFGFMITWSIKKLDGDIKSDYLKHSDFNTWNFDRRITHSIIEEMKKYKIIYTYYGSRFDIPFIRSRALKYNLSFPIQNQIIHRDLYYIVRNKLALTSNALGNVTHYLGIEGKNGISKSTWLRASYGDKSSIKYILDHNIRDVKILEELYKKIRPYMARSRTSI